MAFRDSQLGRLIAALDAHADEIRRDYDGWSSARLVPVLQQILDAAGSDDCTPQRLDTLAARLQQVLDEETKYRTLIVRIMAEATLPAGGASRALPELASLPPRIPLDDRVKNECVDMVRRLLEVLAAPADNPPTKPQPAKP